MLDKPILQGKTITLRPLKAEDAKMMFSSLNDPNSEANRLTGTQETFTFEQVQAFCEKIEKADDRVDYAIVSKENPNIVLGEVVLNDIDFVNGCAGFRIAIYDDKNFGKGYGSQATKLILKFGFETLNLHRIELEVYDFNPRAVHVYEKAGFVREGVRRDALLWNGKYQNAIFMGMLKSDFEKLNF